MADDIDTGEDVIEEIAPRTIRFPAFESNGRTVDSITLQPPTIGQIMEAQKERDPLKQTLLLIQKMASIAPQVSHQLNPKVVEAAGKYIARFLPPPPPKAGGEPLPE